MAAEAALSRFRPDSELSLLNAAPGRCHLVSPLLGRVLSVALAAARQTDGLFDPTVLPDVEAAGYDRPLAELLRAPARHLPPRPVAPRRPWPWAAVHIDGLAGTRDLLVDRPPGLRFDLGGIVKGWIADRAALRLARFGPAAVDAGGDVRIIFPRRWPDPSEPAGSLPRAWPVTIADPLDPRRTLAQMHLQGGAVATSDTQGRRWPAGAGWQHHLIDPRTGSPADTDTIAATVVARTAALAEALAKACILLGGHQALALAGRHGALALLVQKDRSIIISRDLRGIADVRDTPAHRGA